jgi:hypothetical protein
MRIATYLLLPCLLFSSKLASQNHDLFPLKLGATFSYSYNLKIEYYWVGALEAVFVDTGMVNYNIQDSLHLADTSIAWTIKEQCALYQGYLSADSLTFVNSDQTFTLNENTGGRHAIRSPGLAWSFPIDSSYPVYRFSDSSHATIVAGTDTLWFADSAGFMRRSAYGFQVNPQAPHYSRKTYLHVILLSQTAVSVASEMQSPVTYKLEQNYPNPFNPSTRIPFFVPFRSHIALTVFDLLGRRVASVAEGLYSPGHHEILFDGSHFPSGVYFYRLRSADFVQTRKMIILK